MEHPVIYMIPACQNEREILNRLKVDTHWSPELQGSIFSSGSQSTASYCKRNFQKNSSISLRVNPDMLNLPGKLLINTDLGFRLVNYFKLSAGLLASRAQLTVPPLRRINQLKKKLILYLLFES